MNKQKVVWVGQDVTNLRLRLGMTVSDLARRLSCSVDEVRTWRSETVVDSIHYNQLQGLLHIAEGNAVAMSHRPLADSVMSSNGLNQITEDELSDLMEGQ
ncbi:MAG: hypothetical protein KDD61_00745 [Bdellovibrionales bacterium]|nr:hypothetical protein [Bdellovibrionales bacterium]